MTKLTTEQIDTFQRDGVVHLKKTIDDALIERITAAVESLIDHPSKHGANVTPEGRRGMFFQDRHLFPTYPEFRALLHEVPFAKIAAQAMHSKEIRAFYEQVFIKDPGTQENFVWHQDRPYWYVDGGQICSTWLSLSSATADSSALEFVTGSHRWDVTYRPEFPGLEGKSPEELEKILWPGLKDYLATFEDECPQFEAEPDKYTIVSFAVEPGDVLLFDYRIVHRSGPNNGTTRRAAISWRWLGDDAVWAPKFGADPLIKATEIDLAANQPPVHEVFFPLIEPETDMNAAAET